MTREKFFVTDPGIDDSTALKCLHELDKLDPSQLFLISTFGNVPERQALMNLQQIVQVLQLDPESTQLVRGPNRPLEAKYTSFAKTAVYKGNGTNGLWDIPTPDEVLAHPVPNSTYLNQLTFSNNPKELFSLGPLTGPVLLLRRGLNPNRILVMGGAFGEGNVRQINKDGSYLTGGKRIAEWNVFKDARAARIFFEKYAKNVVLVTKDACMGALITAQTILAGNYRETPDTQFFRKVLQSWVIKYGEINQAVVDRGLMLADLIAIIAFNYPDLFHWENTGIEVSDQIGPDLGVTVRSFTNPKCKVAVAVNVSQLPNLMSAVNQTVYG